MQRFKNLLVYHNPLLGSTTAVERIHFRPGVPNDEIVNVVTEVNPDLLVMGTLAHCGISGILIGNTAEKVMRRVECSVLTAKPSDFISPIMND